MADLIDRQAAIDKADSLYRDTKNDESYMITGYNHALSDMRAILKGLPSAQPEISRIEQELHGKTPEEQYDFIYWLLLKFALAYTDSRLAVVEWLRGEKEDE